MLGEYPQDAIRERVAGETAPVRNRELGRGIMVKWQGNPHCARGFTGGVLYRVRSLQALNMG